MISQIFILKKSMSITSQKYFKIPADTYRWVPILPRITKNYQEFVNYKLQRFTSIHGYHWYLVPFQLRDPECSSVRWSRLTSPWGSWLISTLGYPGLARRTWWSSSSSGLLPAWETMRYLSFFYELGSIIPYISKGMEQFNIHSSHVHTDF